MGKLQRKAFRLALGKVKQDSGDVIRLGFKIDASNDVGPFSFSAKPAASESVAVSDSV